MLKCIVESVEKWSKTGSPPTIALEYATKKVYENQVGLKLNWICLLLAYADDVNLLGDSIRYHEENKVTLFGLEIYVEKTTYMLLFCQQNTG
jgi:hypothetical protein